MFKLGGSNLRKLAATSAAVAFVLCSGSAGCSGVPAAPQEVTLSAADAAGDYRIGPLDQLQVFVWRAPDLSVNVHVRPDGKITIPLVEDLAAAGKTATELAREIEQKLEPYVHEPSVSVVVEEFADYSGHTIRVIGEAVEPTSVAYRPGLSVLDVMTAAKGLSEFAAGNRAKLIRGPTNSRSVYSLRLDDLLRDGDVEANAPVLPGDVIVIPPSLL